MSLAENWRTINIDALDAESSSNFDTTTLHPAFAPVSADEIRSIGQQVKQLLRGGDAEGALRGALESAPYGGDASVKVRNMAFVVAGSIGIASFCWIRKVLGETLWK
jgi:actin related protein 2/3 complex subunit 5